MRVVKRTYHQFSGTVYGIKLKLSTSFEVNIKNKKEVLCAYSATNAITTISKTIHPLEV